MISTDTCNLEYLLTKKEHTTRIPLLDDPCGENEAKLKVKVLRTLMRIVAQ